MCRIECKINEVFTILSSKLPPSVFYLHFKPNYPIIPCFMTKRAT